MRRGVSVRAYGGADEETASVMIGEGTGVFSKKADRKKRKEGTFRKKVHKFLFDFSLFSKIETFFSQKTRPFETKFLLLRLIKHNFPFIPPHCGVHIAQSRGTVPDLPAQMLFDLLNHRDFALSLPIGTSPKDATLQRVARLYTSVTSYIQSSLNRRSHNTQTPIIQQLVLTYETTSKGVALRTGKRRGSAFRF